MVLKIKESYEDQIFPEFEVGDIVTSSDFHLGDIGKWKIISRSDFADKYQGFRYIIIPVDKIAKDYIKQNPEEFEDSKEGEFYGFEGNPDDPGMIRVNESCGRLKEGNPVSEKLPLTIDSFLQDLAQEYGKFNYRDIMEFVPDSIRLKQLKQLRHKFVRMGDSYDWNDPEIMEIVNKVTAIIKSK